MNQSTNSKETAKKAAETLPEPAQPRREPADSPPEPQSASASPPLSPPPPSPRPPNEIPPLAIRCDGKVLLATTDLQDIDLSSRELWIGLVLTEAEASDVHDRLNFEEAASPTAARIRAKKPKKPDSDE